MPDVGIFELLLLAGLGLIVLGPQRLPKVAAQLGRWVGQARRMSRTLMYQLRQEVNLDDPRPFTTRPPTGSTDSGGKTGQGNTGDAKDDTTSDAVETPEKPTTAEKDKSGE